MYADYRAGLCKGMVKAAGVGLWDKLPEYLWGCPPNRFACMLAGLASARDGAKVPGGYLFAGLASAKR